MPDAAGDGAPTEAPEAPGLPSSVRAFSMNLVDYAGLFPPAGLSLRAAMRRYAGHRDEEHAWLLSRFVVPARRLPDLEDYAALFSDDARRTRGGAPPYRFSVLGTGGDTPEAFLERFEEDLDAVDAFAERRQGRAAADVMEEPLPAALHDADPDALEAFFKDVHRRLVMAGTAQLDLYYELPLTDATAELVPLAARAAAAHNARQEHPLRAEVGLKFRCGGEASSDVPAPGHLAAAIAACQRADVRFKAATGLRRAVRHHDDDLGTWRHGFLNVFAAAALAEAQDLGVEVLRDVLLEENADHFQFRPDALVWGPYAAPTAAIERAREHLAASFGSCSVEDTVAELHDAGLL